MTATKSLDVICLGRAAVDLYGEQIGSRLEDVQTFAKYLGGSSANMAYGAARLGLKVAMLTRVGDDAMGTFVREELARAGVDVSHVRSDPERLTGLVLLGIKDQQSFPLIFYRENCADMAIGEADVDPQFIASARLLVITGTHLSTPSTLAACRRAIEAARQHQTRVVLDIDYRPVLWGLTKRGDGEQRYVASRQVSEMIQTILPLCDIVVGTEEEINIAGGASDLIASLQAMRHITQANVVVKRGALGASVFSASDSLPTDPSKLPRIPGFPVDILNVLGAGDAFMAGFLHGIVSNQPLSEACRLGNACGALVVSRHGCAPAMPTERELNAFLADHDTLGITSLDRLHRATTRDTWWPEVFILAFDHRRQLEEMAAQCNAPTSQISVLKQLIATAAERVVAAEHLHGKAGVLIDDKYGHATLNNLTGKGLWIGRPVELPGSRPLRFERGDDIGSTLRSWPKEHIVKCLVFYHPDDDDALQAAHMRKVQTLQNACHKTGHEWLLEIILPKDITAHDLFPMSRAVGHFYAHDIYPDWWKLPPPSTEEEWHTTSSVITSHDADCRGIVLLGLDAPLNELKASFTLAQKSPLCRGFAVGRTIFGEAARAFLARRIDPEQTMQLIQSNYTQLIHAWRHAKDAA